MAFKDLRDWLSTLEREGELARVKTKVNWDLEIGGIMQENFDRQGPALLFENIKDHENTVCKRFFTASLLTFSRIALMMGLPKDTPPRKLVEVYMERSSKAIKPKIVKDGPIKQNKIVGEEIDLSQFPAPRYHDRDGGRYIGTFDGVVTIDPEDKLLNVGLYRRMVHDRNHVGLSFPHGQHAWVHWRKHKKMGEKSMPVAFVIGWDPVLPMIACASVPLGVCEYDVMGAVRQKPVELIKCETSDLMVPASAEMVFEGEVTFDVSTFRMEGPFAEYPGYYVSDVSTKPVMKINCITYRDDPILQGTMESVPINEDHRVESINHSTFLWQELNRQMIGVTGVNVDPSTGWANAIRAD